MHSHLIDPVASYRMAPLHKGHPPCAPCMATVQKVETSVTRAYDHVLHADDAGALQANVDSSMLCVEGQTQYNTVLLCWLLRRMARTGLCSDRSCEAGKVLEC